MSPAPLSGSRTPPGIALAGPARLAELEAHFGGEADACARATTVVAICSPEQSAADPELGMGCLVLLTSPQRVEIARGSRGVVLCVEPLAPRLSVGMRWRHATPLWVMTQLLGPAEPRRGTIHPGATVDAGAELGEGVVVRAGAVIHAGVHVGRDTIIGENTVVYSGVRIGARVSVGAMSVLGREGFGWTASPTGALVRVPQRGGVVIGDDVEIGPCCTVDAGTLGPTTLEDRARLDAHVHVGHNVTIGSDTLVAAQAGFAGSVRVGRGVLIGGQAGCADHVTIGDGARVAAQSGVIGRVPAGAQVAGFPAVPRARLFRALARLFRDGRPASPHEQRDGRDT